MTAHLPPADLTAFAHDEGDEPWRARVSAHLLACVPCRAQFDRARSLLGALRGLDVTLASVEAAAARRAGRRAVGRRTGAAAAAAALVAWFVAPGGGAVDVPREERAVLARAEPPPRSEAVPRATPAAAPDLSPLLAAQQGDGRWTAGPGAERRDAAATALALLALLPRAGVGPDAVPRGDAARAVAAGTRWLLARQRGDGGFGAPSGSLEDDAIAASALLSLHERTGDAAVEGAAGRAVRRVAREAARLDAGDVSALRWSRHALARARERGLARVDGALAGVEQRLLARGERPDEASLLSGTGSWAASRRDGAALALRVLRGESAAARG